MFEALNELRFPERQIVQSFDERHLGNFVPRTNVRKFERSNYAYRKAASGLPDAAQVNAIAALKCEIHARAGHPKVIIWPVNEVPAEITHPADVWREADFDAGADLANSL